MSREMFSGNLRNRLHSDEWLIWQDQYEAKRISNMRVCLHFPMATSESGEVMRKEQGLHFHIFISMECLTSQRHLCVNFPHFRTGLESDFM